MEKESMALEPTSMVNMVEELKPKVVEESEPNADDHIFDLSISKGWKLVEGQMQYQISELKKGKKLKVNETLEVYAARQIAIDMAIEHLIKVIDKVTVTAKYVRDNKKPE